LNDRLLAFGTQLVETHLWLRDELDQLRDDVDAYLSGDGSSDAAARPRDLRAHCLTFCSALSRHHLAEDDNAFPAVAAEFPELRPTLEQLTHDHHVVADILTRIEALVADLAPTSDPAEAERVNTELEGLSAILETHFRFEEKRLVDAYNAMTSTADSGTSAAWGLDLTSPQPLTPPLSPPPPA
jgi:iron-sulfur cluster repair protein YtfE (RIC family)